MASPLVNDLLSSYNDQMANPGMGTGPTTNQVDIQSMIDGLIQENPPEQIHNWFRDSHMFTRGWKKPDGTNYDIPVDNYWDEIVDQKKIEYKDAVITEAIKSEINLFPGMIALVGEALTYPVRHPLKTNEFLNTGIKAQFEAVRHPIRTAKALGRAVWTGGKEGRSAVWNMAAGRNPQYVEDEAIAAPQNLTSLITGEAPTGPITRHGTEDLPLSYRLMEPYFQSYNDLIEVEAEYINALNKQRGVDEISAFGPGLSMGIGSVAANAGAAAINPVGKTAKLVALGTGLTVKGVTLGIGALVGSGNAGRVLRGVSQGGKWAKTKLGMSLDLLARTGRGAHPAVDGAAFAEGLVNAELRAARKGAQPPGAPRIPSMDEIISNIFGEVQVAETRRLRYIAERKGAAAMTRKGKVGGVPTAVFEPRPFQDTKLPYVTKEQMTKLRGAAAADAAVQNAGLGHLVPQKATALWKEIDTMVRQGEVGRHYAEPALAAQARQTHQFLTEFAQLSGQKNALSPAVKEAGRVAKAVAKDPNSKRWRMPRFFDPVWKMTGNAKEAYRIAGSFLNEQQTYLRQVGVDYQRMKTALPDPAIRQDMIPFLEETANPWRLAKGEKDTYAGVVQRLKDSGHFEQAVWWKNYLRDRFDNLFKEMNELNVQIGDGEYQYVKNWLHHMWDEPIKDVEAKLGSIPYYELPIKHGSERPRFFNTYHEGMTKAKLTPRTDDIAVMYGLMEQQLARVLATKKLVKELNEFGLATKSMDLPAFVRLTPHQGVPKGYVRFRSAFTDRIMREEVPEGVRKNTTVYVHEEVGKHLRNIIEQPTELGGMMALSAIAKRSNFMFTLFHMYSLAESSVALLNPIQGMRVNLSLAKNNLLARGSGWADGEALAHLVTPNSYKEAFTSASEAGVKLSAPMNDIMADQFSELANRLASKAPTIGGKRLAKGSVKKLLKMQEWFDTAIWSKYHTPMKVIAYDITYNNLKMIRDTGGGMGRIVPENLRWMKKGLQEMDDEALSRAVGSYINDEFGSQAFETHTRGWIENWMSKPNTLKQLNFAFTSVDWNASAIRASLSFAQAIPGLRSSNPARGIMGLRHWRNALMGWAFYANIMNKVLSGHYMWENEPGKKVFYVDTGQVDEDGRPIMWHIGKQFRELGTAVGAQPGLQAGGSMGFRPGYHGAKPYVHSDGAFIGTFLGRKIMPWIQVPFSTIMDVSIQKARYLKEGKEMGWDDGFTIAVNNAIGGFTPFSLGAFTNPALRGLDWDQKLVLGIVGTALPLSKGLSTGQLTAMVADAVRREDWQRYNQIIMDLTQSRGAKVAGDIALNAKELAATNPTEGELEVNPFEQFEEGAPPPQNPLQRLRQHLRE